MQAIMLLAKAPSTQNVRLFNMIVKIQRRALLKFFVFRKTGLSIIDLPGELIDIIFSLLPQIWQGCLALSCKRFYQRFRDIFKERMFQHPNSNGDDDRLISVDTRSHFLSMLQSPEGSWSSFSSRRWMYCQACLKLHSRNECDPDVINRISFSHRLQCLWPGIIVLCPCLQFSPKKLPQIASDLKKAELNSDGMLRHIPNWHECKFDSPCGRMSYHLSISVSLNRRNFIVFRSTYLIFTDNSLPYEGERKIRLCSHQCALKLIRDCNNLPQSSYCEICRRPYSISRSDDLAPYRVESMRQWILREKPLLKYIGTIDFNWANNDTWACEEHLSG